MSTTTRVDVKDLAVGETRAIEAEGTKLLVCRTEDGVYAIENRCPHAAIRLDAARLRGCILECPVHGGTLDVRDGSPVERPIRKAAKTYAVALHDGVLEITLGG